MHVNGIPIENYGGALQSGYKVSGAELDTQYLSTGQFPKLLAQRAGMKTIQTPVTFFGKDPIEAYWKYSEFCMALFGTIELALPDGRLYTAVLTKIAEEKYITDGVMDVTLTFVGTAHGPKQVVTGNSVVCESTAPKTACILTATVSASGNDYKIGSVTFPEVKAGEVLTVDGINGRILVNGAPAAQRAEWISFPYLAPGINRIECQDTLRAEFYPAYF